MVVLGAVGAILASAAILPDRGSTFSHQDDPFTVFER
jgi:hypothetical protein